MGQNPYQKNLNSAEWSFSLDMTFQIWILNSYLICYIKYYCIGKVTCMLFPHTLSSLVWISYFIEKAEICINFNFFPRGK